MELTNSIGKKSVLVVGDVMLDTYFTGEVSRISPEAPVPVYLKRNERRVLGGAANVAANLVAAGQKVSILTTVGNDISGKLLIKMLEYQSVNTSMVFKLERQTTEKTRFLATNNQQVLRLDVEENRPINDDECSAMLSVFDTKLNDFDMIVVSDYMKGLLTYDFLHRIIIGASKKGIPVLVDVKDKNIAKYEGAYMLKPNTKELHELTGMQISDEQSIIEASQALRERCKVDYILTTCGAKGMVLVGNDEPFFVDSVSKEVFDVTGAGDTTIAYFAACFANGYNIMDSVRVANYAAGVQVTKVGTSLVHWDELISLFNKHELIFEDKIYNISNASRIREKHKKKKIVFTNGCFDLLHVGHVKYLREASKLGDVLVVGVNSDKSVKRLKGEQRPINSQIDRVEILAALEFVDYVIIFDEDTPYELIKMIQPDVLVKGGDYEVDNIVGKDIVDGRGGEVKVISFVEGKSTTNIITKIKN